MNLAKRPLKELESFKTNLEHLSENDLWERLAKLEEMGKATKARVDAGELGEPVGYHMDRGLRCVTYSLESALNVQRTAWQYTMLEIRRRAAREEV